MCCTIHVKWNVGQTPNDSQKPQKSTAINFQCITQVNLSPDSYLYRMNDVSRELYIVAGGMVELLIEQDDQLDFVESTRSAGQVRQLAHSSAHNIDHCDTSSAMTKGDSQLDSKDFVIKPISATKGICLVPCCLLYLPFEHHHQGEKMQSCLKASEETLTYQLDTRAMHTRLCKPAKESSFHVCTVA